LAEIFKESPVSSANVNPHSPNFAESQEGEMNLVAQWSRIDPTRWICGILAGVVGGVVLMFVAGLFASSAGMEFVFPIKLMATPFLGSAATQVGPNFNSLLVGALFIEAISTFWGFVYSHFVYTNKLGSLAAMGIVWGIYLWIFNWNLYLQSFKTISVTQLPRGPVMAVCLAYGLSLVTVSFFDRALRGSKS
jgi:hypothetical protein